MNKLGFLLLLLNLSLISYGQQLDLSNPYNGGTNLNPAFIGKDSTHTMGTTFKIIHPGLKDQHYSFLNWTNFHIPGSHSYFGFEVSDHRYHGRNFQRTFSLTYAQNIGFNDVIIRSSLQAQYFNHGINWQEFAISDQIDNQLGFIYQSALPFYSSGWQQVKGINFSAGIYSSFKGLELGFTAYNLLEPANSFVNSPNGFMRMNLGMQVAYNFNIGEHNISPFYTYKRIQNFTQSFSGINYQYKSIGSTIAFRSNDAIITGISFQKSWWSISYFYDYTISRLGQDKTWGSHEISLLLRPFKKWTKSFDKTYVAQSAFMQ